MGDRDFSGRILREQCFQASFTRGKTSVHAQSRYPHPDSCLFFFFSFFMLRKLKGMKRIQAEGTLIISPFCKNQKGDCGDQISKISGKHQGEIFSRILPFHLAIACLSDKYARAYFMSGARVFLTPSFQRVCLSLSWNLCSSLYKGPMLLLSKMQT